MADIAFDKCMRCDAVIVSSAEAVASELTTLRAEVERLKSPDMVLLPRKPPEWLIGVMEGITDFTLPDVFENTLETRRNEMRGAYLTMVEEWDRHTARAALQDTPNV